MTLPKRLERLHHPPVQFFTKGESLDLLLQRPCVAIVGSRAVSPYGKYITDQISRQLAQRGIVIISGLALGVDSIAHRGALAVGGCTIAVLPGPISIIYPRAHTNLARQIIEQGGALVSEYTGEMPGFKDNFIARNRIIAGLADAVLITEAAEKSGSLHTARFALEQGKDVLAMPGNVNSPQSVGTNNLIKAGATPITNYKDVLHALKLKDTGRSVTHRNYSPEERKIVDGLEQGFRTADDLLALSQLNAADFNKALTMLEITGVVRPTGGNTWSLS